MVMEEESKSSTKDQFWITLSQQVLYTEPEQPDHQNPEPYEEPEILSPDDFFEVEDDDDEAIQQAFKQMSSQCDDDLQKGFCIETPEEE